MNKLRSIAICLAVIASSTVPSLADEKKYEAVVRLANGSSTHVVVGARDFYAARDHLSALYCGDTTGSCILEGPWERH